MNICFLTFSPLHLNAGHMSRLKYTLENISEGNSITIICLGVEGDTLDTQNNYTNVSFKHYPINFDGWNIIDLDKVVNDISLLVLENNFELVVQCMEVWDLMRELPNRLKKIRYIAMLHALPFLGTPMFPLGDFTGELEKKLRSTLDVKKKKYIEKHYIEFEKVLSRIEVLSCNKTVSYYLNKYIPQKKFHEFSSIFHGTAPLSNKIKAQDYEYDFLYMARIESGKGIEFLEEILTKISLRINREVKILIAGKVDDVFSENKLNDLIAKSKNNTYFKVYFVGWINDTQKQKLLPKCNVFLYPSYYDTYAIVINEALAHGLPVIVWNTPFYECNYADVDCIISVRAFDTDLFADVAAKELENRHEIDLDALLDFETIPVAAKKDLLIYKNIIDNKL